MMSTVLRLQLTSKLSDVQRGQRAPVEAVQACTALSSNGEAMASNANAAQDLSSYGLDLHSPDILATASQVGAMMPT